MTSPSDPLQRTYQNMIDGRIIRYPDMPTRRNGLSVAHLDFTNPHNSDPAPAEVIEHYAGKIEAGIQEIRHWLRAMCQGAQSLGVDIDAEGVVAVIPDDLSKLLVSPMRDRAKWVRDHATEEGE